MQATAEIENLKNMDTVVKGKYSIWRRDFENPYSNSTLKLMRDQIIMAKAYANIAKSKNQSILYNSLLKHVGESLRVIGDANSDADLHPRYHANVCCSISNSFDHAKAMGHALSIAKDELYDCHTVARKLRESKLINIILIR